MSSDYNTSSAGEDSCDTVIYMGSNGQISDRDLSDNERPPSPRTFKAMQMKLTSSSEDETSEPVQQIADFDLSTNSGCIGIDKRNMVHDYSNNNLNCSNSDNKVE